MDGLGGWGGGVVRELLGKGIFNFSVGVLTNNDYFDRGPH